MSDFSEKTAIVTGAGKGIGRATAQLLTAHGAKVVAISRTRNDLDALRDEVGCRTIVADLADSEAARSAMNEAGHAHFLVNCAGTNVPQELVELSDDAFDQVMNVNLRAAMICAQQFAKSAIDAGTGGAIVNVTSISGQRGFRRHMVYAASKAALDSATRVMAHELGSHNIRVNAVAPTVTNTALAKNWQDPVRREPMIARHPSGRFAEPADVARTIVMLLTDAAAMTTGAVIPVDGGFLSV